VGQTGSFSRAVAWAGGPLGYASPGRHWGDDPFSLGPWHLVGYAGLGASVHQSGETSRGGRITKEGRSDLRGVMVEAAWVAVEHHPRLPSPV
jgi:Transposase IS116/IS110/IS902 family